MVLTRDCSHSARQHIEVHCCSLHFHLSAGLQFSGKVVWWKRERNDVYDRKSFYDAPLTLRTAHSAQSSKGKARQELLSMKMEETVAS